VVYKIESGGTHGKIVSLDEKSLEWSTVLLNTSATNKDDGMYNMNEIKKIPGWKSLYPAFAWGDSKNENGVTGWYLPAINELQELYYSWNDIDDALTKYGTAFSLSSYYSSTQTNSSFYAGFYGSWRDAASGCELLSFHTGDVVYDFKTSNGPYRAIIKF
jgi:hypothetical protein